MGKGSKAKGSKAKGTKAKGGKGKKIDPVIDVIQGRVLSDDIVAAALGDIMHRPPIDMLKLMQRWAKPILKVPIPGVAGRVPSKEMMEAAKMAVTRFFERQAHLGMRSHVVKAFYMASGERNLHFDWPQAIRRVRRARLDRRRKIDSWKECLAMASGDTVADSEIFIAGTRRVTLRALTSLMCHEGLHNLARRTRRGNPYLGEETEHIAMALIGDPQLSA
mmetsp:Transcript_83478/g.145113  ORF Transcript_83478/g.145113 Transcript_83478/m.145113 type:complete len:220 (-) Transcript_83478:109-768(-)